MLTFEVGILSWQTRYNLFALKIKGWENPLTKIRKHRNVLVWINGEPLTQKVLLICTSELSFESSAPMGLVSMETITKVHVEIPKWCLLDIPNVERITCYLESFVRLKIQMRK